MTVHLHIKEQKTMILADEYKEFLNKKVQINKCYRNETAEYENANIILTPSRFVKKSFEKFKFSKIKSFRISYKYNKLFSNRKNKKK